MFWYRRSRHGIMEPMASEVDDPILSRWMFPFEIRIAVRAYRRWRSKLDFEVSRSSGEKHRIAMNAAYGTVACLWGAMFMPPLMVAAFSFSSNRVLTVVCALVAVPPVAIAFVRGFQSARWYSRPYRGLKFRDIPKQD